MRLARGFPATEFQDNVSKSIRIGQALSDEHWTGKWKIVPDPWGVPNDIAYYTCNSRSRM